MKKIVLIVCYFGKFRRDYELWLHSCKENPQIDWMVFSDCNYDGKVPNNVKIIKKSFEDLKKMIQKKFEFSIALEDSYKLCDYKVAYGYIFNEYIKGYDFWGYCDMDMVFGDISKFINDTILNCYDKIFTLGHLSLYRNTKEINELFMKNNPICDYKKVFSTNQICVFDELDKIYKVFKYYNKKIYEETRFVDLSPRNIRLKMSEICNYNTKSNYLIHNYKYQTFIYYKNKVYRIYMIKNKNYMEEFAYIHYSKHDWDINEISDMLYFTKNKIVNNYKEPMELTKKDYNILNKSYNVLYEKLYKYCFEKMYRIKKRIKFRRKK